MGLDPPEPVLLILPLQEGRGGRRVLPEGAKSSLKEPFLFPTVTQFAGLNQPQGKTVAHAMVLRS